MSEINVNPKSPFGIIIIILVVLGFGYYQFFMPVHFSSRDKADILEKVKDIRVTELAKLTDATVKHYKTTGKSADVLDKVKALSGKIVIKEIKSKRSLFSGIKIKVIYTMGGETPKDDDGIRYFKLYKAKKRKNRSRQRLQLRSITEKEYNK